MLNLNRHTTKLKRILARLTLETIISHRGEDPWVIYWQGYYYYCRDFEDRMIMVNKARRLKDIGKQNHTVWMDPSGSSKAEVWAPELHRINNKWYIYFAKGFDKKHRMYVLEGKSNDPQGAYILKAKINDASNQWAIDCTTFEWKKKRYLLWSGKEKGKDKVQNLYIARMKNPWTLSSKRVCISRPEHEWEMGREPIWTDVNEGPQALEHNGKLFIIYSASHSLLDNYCLGQLQLIGDDPLLPSSWLKKEEPVFRKTGSIFGPGHASFIEKPDGSDWIIYHSTSTSNAGWDARILRAQQFFWNADGSPAFGEPRMRNTLNITEKFRYKKTKKNQ